MEPLSLIVLAGAVGVSSVLKSRNEDIIQSLEKRIGEFLEEPRRLEVGRVAGATVNAEMDLEDK